MYHSSETDSDKYVRPRSTEPEKGKSIAWLRDIVKRGSDDSLQFVERSFFRRRPLIAFTDERQLVETVLGTNN